MRILTAQTTELDDVAAAVDEILQQLDLEHNLLANAAGMVSCYPEFLSAGVVDALCDKLPFDIMGTTTIANATAQDAGTLMLALTVFTCNEIDFTVGMTEPLGPGCQEVIDTFWQGTLEKREEKPSMAIVFAPLFADMGGDEMVAMIDKATGGLPFFGGMVVDDTDDYHTAQAFCNKTCSKDAMAVLSFYGDAEPLFLVGSISEDKVLRQKAVITASQGNLLQTVNDMPVLAYMESLGLAQGGKLTGLNTIPFVLDYNDGTKPVTRSIFALNDEGAAVCGGSMPVGASLSIGAIDHKDILATAAGIVQRAEASGKNTGAVLFSCLGRYLVLGMDYLDEMSAMTTALSARMPVSFAYVGGEFCPMPNEGGKLVNRFHNVTLIACVF